MPTWTEGAWGANAGAEGVNGATHGVSVGIDGPGGHGGWCELSVGINSLGGMVNGARGEV